MKHLYVNIFFYLETNQLDVSLLASISISDRYSRFGIQILLRNNSYGFVLDAYLIRHVLNYIHRIPRPGEGRSTRALNVKNFPGAGDAPPHWGLVGVA